jgi:hypothetical protein
MFLKNSRVVDTDFLDMKRSLETNGQHYNITDAFCRSVQLKRRSRDDLKTYHGEIGCDL